MPLEMGTLKIVPFSSILPSFDERGRQLYEHISELAASIKERGLICPLAVYSTSGEPPFKLIAGGRRYKALELLKAQEVGVRIFIEELSPTELTILELYENIHREDLEWPERIALTNRINQAFIEIKGPKVSRQPGAKGHSLRDTAAILGRSPGQVSDDTQLAKIIQDFPELGLQNSKNQFSATKAVKRLKTMLGAKVLGKPNTPLEQSYVLGDFFNNQLEAESYHFLEVDPPYGIDLHSLRPIDDQQQLDASYVEIPVEDYPQWMLQLCEECFRLAAPNSWIVMWCDPGVNYGRQTLVFQCLERVGFKPNNIPGMWKKGNNPGQTNSPSTALGNMHEPFIYARKGEAQLSKMGRGNVFDFSGVSSVHRIHPTERPIELMLEILNTFCWPSSNVLVPFAGSGNTLIAASRLGHHCVGFDLSHEFQAGFLMRIGGTGGMKWQNQ